MTSPAAPQRVGLDRIRVLELEHLWQEMEWRRCMRDKRHFFKTYVWIPDSSSTANSLGLSRFKLWDYQDKDLKVLDNNAMVCCLKSRQLGITTLVMADNLWYMAFRPGFKVKVLSKNQAGGENNIAMFKVMLSNLPRWMKDRLGVDTKGYLDGAAHVHLPTLAGRTSKLTSGPSTPTTAAGETLDRLVLDEFALIEHNQSSIYNVAKPTVDASLSDKTKKYARLIMLSTPRGGHNFFARTCRSAQARRNEFAFIYHPWHLSRFYSKAQYAADLKQATEDGKPWEFYAERSSSVDEAFRESGNPRFTNLPPEDACEPFRMRGNLLKSLDRNGKGAYFFEPDEEGGLYRIDELPVEDYTYVVACDPATGKGGDNTSITVMRLDADGTRVLVAYWYANNVREAEQADAVEALGYFYAGKERAAQVGVENQGGYGATLNYILRLERQYPHIYWHKSIQKRMRHRAPEPGFPMNAAMKPTVISRLAETIPYIDGIYPELRLELASFVRKPDGKEAADAGCTDDLVMSLAIAVWMLHDKQPVTTQPARISEDTADPQQVVSVKFLFDEIAEQRRKDAQRAAAFQQQFARQMAAQKRTR